jgi:hypothetical protein
MLNAFYCFWLGGMTATLMVYWMEAAFGYPPIFRVRPFFMSMLLFAGLVAWPFMFVMVRRYYERMREED